jgi:hypothetical protein
MITQIEAKELIEERKQRLIEDSVKFPLKGDKITIPIKACDKDIFFQFDVNNTPASNIRLSYQTRKDENIILIRIDINGSHQNPSKKRVPLEIFSDYNGSKILGTHVHIYTERFNDRWAIPIGRLLEDGTMDEYGILSYFYSLCTIIRPPIFEYGLPL